MAERHEGEGELLALVRAHLVGPAESVEGSPAWVGAMNRLGSAPTAEDRLVAYRVVRDAGVLPPEAGFFLVAHTVLEIAGDRVAKALDEGVLKDLGDRIKLLRWRWGLAEGEDFQGGQGPEDYEALRAEWTVAGDGIVADTFRELGEPELAELFTRSRRLLEERMEKGQAYFYPGE